MSYNSFKPGVTWYDTDGNRIQAHAGYMFYENDTFYWYGENKEKSKSEWDLWHWGIRLYSSKDLYNWKSEGIIIEPVTDDETHSLYYNARLDRPHLLYNEKTKKYVMWAKVMTGRPDKLDYAIILRANTGGLGRYTFEFVRYEEVPGNVSQKIIELAQKAE